MRRRCSLLNFRSKGQRSSSLDIKVAIWFSFKILEQSCEIEIIIFLCIWIGIICMHILKDINMWINYSVLRLKKCKYETPCVGYDTQVTVKACGPLVFFTAWMHYLRSNVTLMLKSVYKIWTVISWNFPKNNHIFISGRSSYIGSKLTHPSHGKNKTKAQHQP